MVQREGDWWYESRPVGEDSNFDIEFWQAQGPAAIFAAAWELVETAWKVKGLDRDELRLQRTAFYSGPARR